MEDIQFFDAHSHLNDSQFDADRDAVLLKVREEKVGTIVIGTDRKMSEDAVTIANENENIFAGVALHPNDKPEEIFDEEFYAKLASEPKVVCIGECGIDYSLVTPENHEVEAKRQKILFEKHILLSVSCGKPLMIHCRDAHPDVLEILTSFKREYGDKFRGNIHFFSEGAETAKKYFDLGFTISFTGVITFARSYDEAIQYAPLDRILSETDAPYVAPVPYRGKRNEPLYVKEVVKKLAEIRGEDFEKVKEATVQNAVRTFGLTKK